MAEGRTKDWAEQFVPESSAPGAEDEQADRRSFRLDDEAWARFEELLDASVEDMPRLRRTLTEPTLFDRDG